MSLNESVVGSEGSTEPEESTDVEQLKAENERLRREYARARQSRYRRTAVGLAVVGIVALSTATLVQSVRPVLVTLGGIGLYAAVLTVYLTPERFLSIGVAQSVYDSIDNTGGHLVTELDLTGRPTYIPGVGSAPARLFVPQSSTTELPSETRLESVLVPPDDTVGGLSFVPTGATLFRDFEQTLGDTVETTPELLAEQLGEGLTEVLELADHVRTDVNPDNSRLSVEIQNPVFDTLNRFDHPAVSFLATGLAVGLDRPVRVTEWEDGPEFVVTLHWDDDS